MLFYAGSVLLLIVLGSSTIESLSAQTCLQYAEDGNCDFYTECLEDKYSCGAKGYPVGYGHRYCNRFHIYYNDFNAEGKAWIDDVRKCLMKALVPIYKSNSYSCDEVKTLAFTSHPTCYTESGDRFCKVLWTNKLALLKVFEADDFLGEDSALAIEQILMTGLQCLCDYGLADEIHQIVDATSDVRTKVLDFTTQLWRDDPKEAIQSECEAKALQGDCDFYNCLERRHPCGLKGFASQEGRPLCERLKIKKGLFNAQGQAWVNDFTKCLTRSLLPKYRDESISCRHINNYGYQAQDSCFIDTGICDLEEDKQGGQCQDYTVRTCLAGYETSKCGGNALRRCCLQCDSSCQADHLRWSAGDSSCSNAGGQCKMDSNFCHGQYQTGMCGGPAGRKCCTPGPGGSSSGSGNYGNIMNVDTTGASQTTANQDGLSYNGVPASQQLARNDLSRLNNYKSQIEEAAADKNMDPAVIAATISRESRAGNALDTNGYGDHGNGFGLMQVDKRYHTPVGGPYSTEHIKQGTQILIDTINCVKNRHSDWTAEMALKGSTCTVRPYSNTRFVGDPIHVEDGFRDSMDLINTAAAKCNVKVYITHSWRKVGEIIPGAIVTPSSRSNHFVGHAIDMNVQRPDGTLCNSSCLRGQSDSDATCFIGKVQAAGLTWGGVWSTPDPVHIDDRLNLNTAVYNTMVDSLQKACQHIPMT
uniref:Lysozyme g n=1 Tax=Branchiostoma floridae TaxID=7739 RepID=C3YYL0_BRAFL|eukprot:XP_002598638.1 hypothetical protein BRAFLDRAFT_118365 [Branchiostoma floridae]